MTIMYRFTLFTFFICLTNLLNAQKVHLKIENDAAYFTENKDSILTYQISEKSRNGDYKRLNYIHPLYTLDQQILTEDFPLDHLHHRGVFWAWHQLYVGDKRLGDGWLIKDFSWEIKSVTKLKKQGCAKAIQSEVLWKSNQWLDANGNEKAVVKEVTTIKVYPRQNHYRQIDIEISLLALEKNMRIGGSEDEKGYGGFSPRVRLVDDIQFTGPKGKIKPEVAPIQAGEWLDISGSFGKDGAISGLSILCHPKNPGHPNPWILRSKKSMQNAVYPFPGASPVPLSQINPTILRYRLLIHEGNSNAIDIPAIYAHYGK